MKEYKKYIKISIILGFIAALSGAILSLIFLITNPIIKENESKREKQSLEEIFDNATFTLLESEEESLSKKYEVLIENEFAGFVYIMSGKNSYGVIELMVGINKDKKLEKMVILKNEQSYKTTVEDHAKENYGNNIVKEDVESIDVYCGATFGAKLVKELVSKSFEYFEKDMMVR